MGRKWARALGAPRRLGRWSRVCKASEATPLASEAGRQPAGDGVYSGPVASFGAGRWGDVRDGPERLSSEEAQEAFTAFFEKRKPDFSRF